MIAAIPYTFIYLFFLYTFKWWKNQRDGTLEGSMWQWSPRVTSSVDRFPVWGIAGLPAISAAIRIPGLPEAEEILELTGQ